MNEFILVKNHINAKLATKLFHNHQALRDMKKFMLQKNPKNAKQRLY